jgi:two-component system CheB/CheR fusion protein
LRPTHAKLVRAPRSKNGEDPLADAIRLLQDATGVDFSDYKESTLQRRVQRRQLLTHSASPAAYLRRLRGDPAERDALFQDFLIKVTSFLRPCASGCPAAPPARKSIPWR